MSNMILGGYTFEKNPGAITLLDDDKVASVVKTANGVGYFSWGLTMKGKGVLLTWGGITKTMYDQLHTLYEDDIPLVFDPQDGTGRTFNVEMQKFDGEYLMDLAGDHRVNVKMMLIILNQI